MIVCVCHRVSDRDIAREVSQGCSSFDRLQEETRVATACGACHECAMTTFRDCSRGDAAVPVPQRACHGALALGA